MDIEKDLETTENTVETTHTVQGATQNVLEGEQKGVSIAAMVLGIVGLVFSLCGAMGAILAVPCSVLGVILGIARKKKRWARNGSGRNNYWSNWISYFFRICIFLINHFWFNNNDVLEIEFSKKRSESFFFCYEI
ncbi:MAG: hypothetical protein FWC79_01405 [Oscillospiraceae bacterium]|nr:hypothetical protein [Oscillospiraceae bacterium]